MTPVTTTEQKKEIALVQKKVAEVCTQAETYTIRSQKDLEGALALLKEVGERQKIYKEKIDGEIVAPIKKALNNLVAFVKPLKDRLDFAERTLKGAIFDYREEQKKKIADKTSEIETKVESGEMSFKAGSRAVARQEAKIEAIPTRKQLVVKVVDESQVPEKYWVLDMVSIRRDALGNKAQGIEPIEIPGVKVVEEEIITK